jgi:hypothetical protein
MWREKTTKKKHVKITQKRKEKRTKRLKTIISPCLAFNASLHRAHARPFGWIYGRKIP